MRETMKLNAVGIDKVKRFLDARHISAPVDDETVRRWVGLVNANILLKNQAMFYLPPYCDKNKKGDWLKLDADCLK